MPKTNLYTSFQGSMKIPSKKFRFIFGHYMRGNNGSLWRNFLGSLRQKWTQIKGKLANFLGDRSYRFFKFLTLKFPGFFIINSPVKRRYFVAKRKYCPIKPKVFKIFGNRFLELKVLFWRQT